MLTAQSSGLTNGDYVFITSTMLPNDQTAQPWIRHDSLDGTAQQAYFPLLQVAYPLQAANIE